MGGPGRTFNVGVVADDGSALGAGGNPQADARFGDIRIFAVPLSSNVLAITTPPGDLAGARTGDIILNSNYNFGTGSGARATCTRSSSRRPGTPSGSATVRTRRRRCTSSTWGRGPG